MNSKLTLLSRCWFLLASVSTATLIAAHHSTQVDSLRLQWVREYVSATGLSYDQINDCAVDDSGNVYVTGESDQLPYGSDILTIKYSPSGESVWMARYDCGTHGSDEGRAIAVDAMHNVYVTGNSTLTSTGSDIATVKYSPEGIQLWAARYSTPMSDYDRPVDLAIDVAGNVYVTGENRRTSNTSSYVTIKYSQQGVEQWVDFYPESPVSYSTPAAIGINDSGYVFVTGNSALTPGRPEFSTIKYRPDGETLWVARYAGFANSPAYASALAFGDSGSIYITGYSFGNGTSSDYTTLKYGAGGSLLWEGRYDGGLNNSDEASEITLDRSGNVYVSGQSFRLSPASYDMVTIKYNRAGMQQWVARYAGPGDSYDSPSGIGVDSSGSVYVGGTSIGSGTGLDFATVKYDSAGTEQWVRRFDRIGHADEASGFLLDGSGDPIIAGTCTGTYVNYDYLLIKYSSSGTQQWIAEYDGPGSTSDSPRCMAQDSAGNLYLGGTSYAGPTGRDWVLVKFSHSGVQEWSTRFDGGNRMEDYLGALVLDASGNIYVTGQGLDTLSQTQIVTVKYNNAGIRQWTSRYPGPRTIGSEGSAIALDGGGNVYVSSYNFDNSTNNDIVTLKYTSSGELAWNSRYAGPSSNSDIPRSIAVDDSGAVIIVGRSGPAIATIKYNPSGIQQWATRYSGPLNSTSSPVSIALDARGNAYVAGTLSTYLDTTSNFLIVKYNRVGAQLWAATYQGAMHSSNVARDMRITSAGIAYITGSSYVQGNPQLVTTVKYNPTGQRMWAASYSNPSGGSSSPSTLALDGSENIFVTGQTQGGKVLTLMYDSSGTLVGIGTHNLPAAYGGTGLSISTSQNGDVAVMGSMTGTGWTIFTLLMYQPRPTSFDEVINSLPSEYVLRQNYPNPFNPTTSISFDLSRRASVVLSVYDVLGKEVAVLLDGFYEPGVHKVFFNGAQLASGVYFYQFRVNDFVQTRKMLLQK